MLKKGNADPSVCAKNLLSMLIYDCWLARDKGVDPSLLDKPVDKGTLRVEIARILNRFEKRVKPDEVLIETDGKGYLVDLKIKREGE